MTIAPNQDVVKYQADGSYHTAKGVVVLNAEDIGTNPQAATGNAQNTRSYNFGSGTRTNVGSVSSAPVALSGLGTSREVMLVSSTRCHIRFGAAGVAAAAATAGVLPLPADTMFHLIVPEAVTHFTVIRDVADGFLSVIPVL